MTREESLSIITEAIENYVCNYVTDTAQAQKMLNAIQTLEQEPCEDAISRQAVLDLLEDTNNGWIINEVSQLPSVKPQENTGHWIGIDEEPHEVWECDHCGFVIDGSGCIDPYDYRDTYKYCPYCGAKMIEPQERSDKE